MDYVQACYVCSITIHATEVFASSSAFRMLVIRSLRMKSRKGLSHDMINTSAKRASLVHETYTDTSWQTPFIVVFRDFKRQYLTKETLVEEYTPKKTFCELEHTHTHTHTHSHARTHARTHARPISFKPEAEDIPITHRVWREKCSKTSTATDSHHQATQDEEGRNVYRQAKQIYITKRVLKCS